MKLVGAFVIALCANVSAAEPVIASDEATACKPVPPNLPIGERVFGRFCPHLDQALFRNHDDEARPILDQLWQHIDPNLVMYTKQDIKPTRARPNDRPVLKNEPVIAFSHDVAIFITSDGELHSIYPDLVALQPDGAPVLISEPHSTTLPGGLFSSSPLPQEWLTPADDAALARWHVAEKAYDACYDKTFARRDGTGGDSYNFDIVHFDGNGIRKVENAGVKISNAAQKKCGIDKLLRSRDALALTLMTHFRAARVKAIALTNAHLQAVLH